MTILLILLTAAALFIAMHRAASSILHEDWNAGLSLSEDLDILRTATEDERDDRGWMLWRTDFNQERISP